MCTHHTICGAGDGTREVLELQVCTPPHQVCHTGDGTQGFGSCRFTEHYSLTELHLQPRCFISELTIPELHLMLLESFLPGTLWKLNALGLRPVPSSARLQLDGHFPDLGLRRSAYEVAWRLAACPCGTRAMPWHSRQPQP